MYHLCTGPDVVLVGTPSETYHEPMVPSGIQRGPLLGFRAPAWQLVPDAFADLHQPLGARPPSDPLVRRLALEWDLLGGDV